MTRNVIKCVKNTDMKRNKEDEERKRARTNVFLTYVEVCTSDLCKHILVNLHTHTMNK